MPTDNRSSHLSPRKRISAWWWWHMPLIPLILALRRQISEFQASLVYILFFRKARVIQKILSHPQPQHQNQTIKAATIRPNNNNDNRIQKSTTNYNQLKCGVVEHGLNGLIYKITPSPKAQCTFWKRGQKDCKSQGKDQGVFKNIY